MTDATGKRKVIQVREESDTVGAILVPKLSSIRVSITGGSGFSELEIVLSSATPYGRPLHGVR